MFRKWHIVRLAKISENAKLRRMAACIVSFVDLDGVRHSVEVEAEGLYEASVLGVCAFRKHDLQPGGLTQLDVEVRSPVKHTLTVTKVREWLQRGVRSRQACIPPNTSHGLVWPNSRSDRGARSQDHRTKDPYGSKCSRHRPHLKPSLPHGRNVRLVHDRRSLWPGLQQRKPENFLVLQQGCVRRGGWIWFRVSVNDCRYTGRLDDA